mmetsp:Transcript_3961/g.12383  ORF Transcript_3961/g.12383 Transcript_3961/m.12383 type:complete len:228 (+) Transcript_3961:104-787(+)
MLQHAAVVCHERSVKRRLRQQLPRGARRRRQLKLGAARTRRRLFAREAARVAEWRRGLGLAECAAAAGVERCLERHLQPARQLVVLLLRHHRLCKRKGVAGRGRRTELLVQAQAFVKARRVDVVDVRAVAAGPALPARGECLKHGPRLHVAPQLRHELALQALAVVRGEVSLLNIVSPVVFRVRAPARERSGCRAGRCPCLARSQESSALRLRLLLPRRRRAVVLVR